MKFICNSRPRRFGKSITANMLTAYYSKGCDSKEIFTDLKIGSMESFEKNINTYNVIHFDIQWCIEPAGGSEQVVSYITKTGKILLVGINYDKTDKRHECVIEDWDEIHEDIFD